MDTSLLEKLAALAQRVNLWAFLADFDTLNVKRIYPEQAIRGVATAGLTMTPEEQSAFVAAYKRDDGMFDYNALLADVSNVRPAGFWEKRPDVPEETVRPSARFGFSATSTATLLQPRARLGTAEEEADLEKVLKELRFEAASHRLEVGLFMRQFDPTHRGSVTKERFIRILLSHFHRINSPQAELVARAYAASDGQVRYMALSADVTPKLGDKPPPGMSTARAESPNNRTARRLAEPVLDEETARALTSIIRQFYERRIRAADLFADYAKPFPGRVTRDQFVRALGGLRLPGVDARLLSGLSARYADPTDPTGDSIAWRLFVDEVEASNYERGLEKDPEHVNTSYARTIATQPNPRFSRPALSERDDKGVAEVLKWIKGTCARERVLNLRPFVEDFDKHHEGYLTRDRFQRVLAQAKILPPNAADGELLLRYYGHATQPNLVEYRGFLEDIGL